MTHRTVCAVMVALVASVPDGTLAEVLCQGKGGRLAARESCRKKERPVDGSAFGAAGPEGPAGTPGPPGVPAAFPLRLVDASDAEVGRILQFHPNSAVILVEHPDVPTPLIFNVDRGGFPSDNDGVFYQSNDCSGVPFVRPDNSVFEDSLIVGAVAQVYGLAAYYSSGPVQQLAHASVESYPMGGAPCGGGSTPTTRGTCCSAFSDTRTVTPATRVMLSTLAFEPPFRTVRR